MTRSRHKKNKTKQDFELNPPRCFNCKSFCKEQFAIPGKRLYRPMHCKIGNFPVKEHSICNEWKGIDGSILEKDF